MPFYGQIARWLNLSKSSVRYTIHDEVLTSFARGSEELYSLMQKFVARKCEYKAERKRILELYSADDSIAKLDELQNSGNPTS